MIMKQKERREYLMKYLLKESAQYRDIQIPPDEASQKRLLRGLMNTRLPQEISDEFLSIQDDYLQDTLAERGVVDLNDINPIQNELYIWQGDITRLKADAIVNAANSGMTGCYQPNHTCIDNCIHTYAGIQLRNKCAEIMKAQGHEEPTGQAKITPAYNLPSKYILHTVGPIIYDSVREEDEKQLAACYYSCLKLADEKNCKSIAFCCISTGVFHFPNKRAAEIAVNTVKKYKEENKSRIEVIFNVWKDIDKRIYEQLLG